MPCLKSQMYTCVNELKYKYDNSIILIVKLINIE